MHDVPHAWILSKIADNQKQTTRTREPLTQPRELTSEPRGQGLRNFKVVHSHSLLTASDSLEWYRYKID
jgi:hypothetical protein